MALQQQYQDRTAFTEDEYFAQEEASFFKHEYVNGQIVMMAGASDAHNLVSANLVRSLGNALVPKGCRVYGSDMKVHTGDGVNTYPDAAVVCGPRAYHRGHTDIILNPLALVEVLSPSTQGADRGEKFDHYATIPSLTDYLLVAQDEPRVLLYSRDEDGWRLRLASGLDASIHLPSVDATLALSDIYALIEWENLL